VMKNMMRNQILKNIELYKELYGNEIYLTSFSPKKKSDISYIDNNLNEYLDSIKDCLKCSLGSTRNNIVCGSGSPNAEIVFVSGSPDKDEDLQGLPIVGPSGKLLDKMLSSINLDRKKIYITNVLKCISLDDYNLGRSEIDKCEPYFKKQLDSIKPKLIVALGRFSAMSLLKVQDSVSDLRNKIFNYEGIDFLVTYHPSALLRDENLKKFAWEDFKLIRDKYINV